MCVNIEKKLFLIRLTFNQAVEYSIPEVSIKKCDLKITEN